MSRRLAVPLVALLSAFVLTLPNTAIAQKGSSVLSGSPQAPRITGEVNESHLTRLTGNVPHLAQARFDKGAVSSSTQLTHMRLVLSRTPEQEASLQTFLAQVQSPGSPSYHKWLTPEQFGKLYGPADSDIAAIVAWLESHGLKIEKIPAGRTNIAFSGTVGQVEEAFHTTIHAFSDNGEDFTANTKDPSIPTALASVVSGVARLDTLQPRAHHTPARPGRLDPDSKRLVAAIHSATTNTGKVSPQLTDTGNSGSTLYVTAADAATIYNSPNFLNGNFSSGSSFTGKNVTIGIGGRSVIKQSTVDNYRQAFTGSTLSVTINNVDGVTSTADTNEAYIDTELSAGLAPGANIIYYTAQDLFTAMVQAVDDNTVDIFSLSYGACESNLGASTNAGVNLLWEQAAAQGITVVVSTGDNGSAGCDNTSDNSGNNITQATGGLAVNGLGSTPYNLAIGGTDYYPLLTSFSTYALTSQGTSATYFRTALGYIPESTWNDSTQINETISQNTPYTGTYSDGSPKANIVGGSGGKSSLYNKPYWQSGSGVPADSARDLPDVSLFAGAGYDSAAWLVCTDDTFNQNGTTYTEDCSNSSAGFAFNAYGGTSTAAPAFAGILALMNESDGGRLGQVAPRLYGLFNGTNSSSIFNDVTVGNNSVSCASGSTNCVKNKAGYTFESGYDTTSGYDLASGMGSVNVSNLISFLSTVAGPAAATVTVAPASSTITSTQSVSVVVTVASSASGGATPTGTVLLYSGNYTSESTTLSAGSATFTVPASSLATGANTLAAVYSGDSNYATEYGTATVTVTAATTPSVKLVATAVILAKGASNNSTVTVTPSGGYSGSVVLTCSVAPLTGGTHTPTCTGSTVAIPSGSTAAVTGTVTVSTTAASSNARKAFKANLENHTGGNHAGGILGATAALACVVFFGIPAKRRAWRSFLSLLVLVAGLGVLSGCGGGGGGTKTPSDPGTTAGAYTVTVTGTDSAASITTTTTFTLTVQ